MPAKQSGRTGAGKSPSCCVTLNPWTHMVYFQEYLRRKRSSPSKLTLSEPQGQTGTNHRHMCDRRTDIWPPSEIIGTVLNTNENLRLSGASTHSVLAPAHSPLQISVLVLYSTETFSSSEETQWVTNIVAGFSTANEATANSDIDLQFNLVSVQQVSAKPVVAVKCCRFKAKPAAACF